MATRKRATKTVDDLRPEYDLSSLTGRVQGKYYERARAGTNLVLLKPEIAQAFPDGRAVNDALGLLLRVARMDRLRAQAHASGKLRKRSRSAVHDRPRRRG